MSNYSRNPPARRCGAGSPTPGTRRRCSPTSSYARPRGQAAVRCHLVLPGRRPEQHSELAAGHRGPAVNSSCTSPRWTRPSQIDSELLAGVRYKSGGATTHSLVMRARSGTVRNMGRPRLDSGSAGKQPEGGGRNPRDEAARVKAFDAGHDLNRVLSTDDLVTSDERCRAGAGSGGCRARRGHTAARAAPHATGSARPCRDLCPWPAAGGRCGNQT